MNIQAKKETQTVRNKSGRTWIACGALLLIAICLSVMFFAGGIGVLAALFSEAEELAINVEAPLSVPSGRDFEIIIQIENTGESPITIADMDVSKSPFADYLSVPVPNALRTEYDDYVSFDLNLTLQPGQKETLTLSARSLGSGRVDSKIQFWVGTHSSSTSVVFVVEQAREPESAEAPFEAAVQIIAVVNVNGMEMDGWTGSGTLLSEDGLILTNAHVVLSDAEYVVRELVVALTENPDLPPRRMYKADVMQVNQALDIAVIRIASDLNDQPVDPATLNLPTVPMGDSNVLSLGDSLVILGYPGIGGDTITLTSGEVSGFTSEAGIEGRAFIKTSATIAGGNSGGMALNADGELIGIPTQLGYGGEDQFVDCRVLADTNQDGAIDEKDNCVPTGGFINALRPINLALPYIEAATRGEVNFSAEPGDETTYNPEGNIVFEDDFSNPSSGWDVIGDQVGSRDYQDGQYVIHVIESNYFVFGGHRPDLRYADATLTVRAQVLQPVGDGEIVLVCRYMDNENHYLAAVTEDGYYAILGRINGDQRSLYEYNYDPSIRLDQPVTLSFACIGDRLSLTLNNVLLATVRNDELDSGFLGLGAGVFDTGGVIVGFDEVIVRTP